MYVCTVCTEYIGALLMQHKFTLYIFLLSDLLEAASSITSMTPDPQPAPVPSLPNHTSNAVHTTGFQQSPNVHGLESSPVTNPVSGTLTKASASEDRAVSSTHVLTAANQPSGVCACVYVVHVY